MERVFDGKYHWNPELWEYERAEREQAYKGVKIVFLETHMEGHTEESRYYELTWPDDLVALWVIRKGHGLKELKEYIDRREQQGKL